MTFLAKNIHKRFFDKIQYNTIQIIPFREKRKNCQRLVQKFGLPLAECSERFYLLQC
jgi:hypothetical protein